MSDGSANIPSGWWADDGSPAMDDIAMIEEIVRLRAELAKRERQIVWALRHGADYRANFLTWYLAPDEGNDNRTEIVMDDSDSGLLAAVDEAMGEK